MKAMILAAGLGTRLKPITDHIPKALVEVDGVPMLERIILTLKEHGFDYIVVNAHHFADQIKEFLAGHSYGVNVVISDESEKLLDTGGGIVNAIPLLYKDDREPVLIHNVDILSNAPLEDIIRREREETTLLVSGRESSRKLIFDSSMQLRGWHDLKTDVYRPENFNEIMSSKREEYKELAFSGIYSMSYYSALEMRKLMGEGKYSVMDYFLNPERSVPITGYDFDQLKLIDIGKPATLSQAHDFLSFFN